MKDSRVRKNIKLGQLVKIQKSGSSEYNTGIVKEILSDAFSDPLGIPVLLENGLSGRVKEIIESKEKTEAKSQSNDSIKEIISELEKKRLSTSSDLDTIENEIETKKIISEVDHKKTSELEDLESKLIKKKEEFETIQNKIKIARNEFLDDESDPLSVYPYLEFELSIDTKMKQDLGILERQIRKTIVLGLKDYPNWWKERIPGDVLVRARTRKREYESHLQETTDYEIIDWIDFGDLPSIICRNDNWKNVFSKVLPEGSQIIFEIKMAELNGVRSHLYHNRKVNDNDRKRFEVYYNDIMNFLLEFENKKLKRDC